MFLSEVKARHDRMVEFARRTMSDERGTKGAGRDGERLTTHGPQITATQ
jgi:hypothetical protein